MSEILPIDEIIKEARRQARLAEDPAKRGASFGHGDPRVHLAYLTKLGLLPQSIRRKVNGQLTGCYSKETINKILEIEKLKGKGMSYSQIKLHLTMDDRKLKIVPEDGGSKIEPQYLSSTFDSQPLSSTFNHLASNQSNGVAFLLIGLFLGFLIALGSSKNSPAPLAQGTQVVPDTSSANLIKLTSSQNPTGSEPIYLIAVPRQNFSNLGKMDINSLNN